MAVHSSVPKLDIHIFLSIGIGAVEMIVHTIITNLPVIEVTLRVRTA